MLRPHSISLAAQRRVVFLGSLLLGLAPDAAQAIPGNPPVGGGGSCTYSLAFDGTVGQQQAWDNGLYTCLSSNSTWTPEALILGSTMQDGTSASCNSTNAGLLEYLSGVMQFCNGTSWTSLAGGNNSGTQYQIAYYATTGTTISGDSHITTDSGNDLNITTGALQLGGATVLAYPYSNTDTTSIAVGNTALTSQTASSLNNVAVGYLAGEYISSGASNTAIGESAMTGISATLLTGSNNTAVGTAALLKAQGAAARNTSVGQASLTANTTGAGNTAVGTSALAANTTGVNSTALGYNALVTATTGTNSALGYQAGYYISTGTNNTAIGTNAILGISATNLTGSYNTAVGDSALYTIQGAATRNTAGGYQSLYSATTDTNSTAIGYEALYSQAAGGPNSALGYEAGQYVTTANGSTAIGNLAMQGISATPLTGNNNTALGDSALLKVQGAANNNTAVGTAALNQNTTGANNVAVGYAALNANTTGVRNTAVGNNSLNANTTGTDSTAVGSSALLNATTGANSALGHNAGEYISTATSNTAIGYGAMQGISATPLTGNNNTALGDSALLVGQGAAAGNTAVGQAALTANTTGVDNTALGYQSGKTVTTGTNNTILGYNVASTTLTTGTNNILIGYDNTVTTPAAGTTYNLNIGNLLQGDMTHVSATYNTTLYLQSASSGVNFLEVTNAATTVAPTLSSAGSDTNISLAINPKGTGSVTITATTANAALDLSSNTNSMFLPAGTTGQRPGTPSNGAIRYNSTTQQIEGWYNAQWNDLGAGAAGSGTVNTGTQYQLGYYATTAATISGDSHITTDSTFDLNLTSGTAAYQIGGLGVLYYPDGDTSSLAGGYLALAHQSTASGAENVAVGTQAGQYVSSGAQEVAIGISAMQGISATPLTGSGNTAVGEDALLTIQGAATNNTAAGENALNDNTTGSNNTAVGSSALFANTTGAGSTAVGYEALYSATTGTNTGLGTVAGEYISTGTSNTALGYSAMKGISATPVTGNNNTAVGDSALKTAQGAAAGNTALGQNAGGNITTGTNDIYIGYGAVAGAATDSNEIAIGAGVGGQGSNTITIGNSSATGFYVGTSSIASANTANAVCFNTGTGQLSYHATDCTSSLRRHKRDIKPLGQALGEAMRLQPVEYRWNQDYQNDKDALHLGFIAEDVENLDPRIATYDKTGALDGVDYAHITALDTAAIQEQQQEIAANKDEMNQKISALASQVAALKQLLAAQTKEIQALKSAHTAQ